MATRHSNIFNINIKNDHIEDYFFLYLNFCELRM